MLDLHPPMIEEARLRVTGKSAVTLRLDQAAAVFELSATPITSAASEA